jgi:aspartokinase-like uncharacterized kinase
MTNQALRVVKLGGSLLDMPDLRERFRHWLALQPPARAIVLVGGGRVADCVRDADHLHRLGEEVSHWLAIRAMNLNARLVAAMFEEARLVTELDEIPTTPPSQAEPTQFVILDPLTCMQSLEASPNPLPHTWEVTSDSIAARVAIEIRATELVLLKSTLPQAADSRAAAAAGYVDEYFPRDAHGLTVRCVNFRDDDFPERRLS